MSLSRRLFLARTGATAAAVPILGWRRAHAAPPPRRLVIINWANGCYQPDFWPTLTGPSEGDFTLGQQLSPLAPYRDKLLVTAGDFTSFQRQKGGPPVILHQGHGALPAVLTGAAYEFWGGIDLEGRSLAGGPSVDQFLAQSLAKTAPTRFKSLVLGVRTYTGSRSAISYSGPGSAGITPENNPARLFATLFANHDKNAAELKQLMLRKQSVLDVVGKQVERYAKELGGSAREQLESHLDSVRSLELRLSTGLPGANCEKPTAPAVTEDDYPGDIAAMSDLVHVAFRCDLTRIVTLQWGDTYGGGVVFRWLGDDFVAAGDEFSQRDHHDIAHNYPKSEQHKQRYIKAGAWYYEQVANLVKKLADTPEGDGTMLDNTTVVVTNNSGDNHVIVGVPFVFIGTCGGALAATGRVVRLGRFKSNPQASYWGGSQGNVGVPHNRILASICTAMGVPVESFNESQWGGPLPELLA